MVLQFIVNGICAGALFGLAALGLSLIYNTTKVFHFAHGAVYTSAAYLLFFFLTKTSIGVIPGVIISLALAMLLGVLIDQVFYLPLAEKSAGGTAAILTSLGLYTVAINIIALLFGNETKILRPGLEKTFEIGSVIVTRIQVMQVVAFLVLLLLTVLLLKFSRYGQLIRAVSDNSKLAEALGLETKKARIVAFAYGSGLAAVAACLSALDVGLDPYIGMPVTLIAAVAMIFGGIRIFAAAAIGGVIIGVIQNLVVWQTSSKWQAAVTFVILLVVLIFRPQGLLTPKKRLEES